MQTCKGPQVAYLCAEHQNDESVVPLSSSCLFTGMYIGTVFMEHWRFTGGAAGSSRYGLLGTDFLKIHLWYLFAVIYFTSVVQIFLCNLPNPKAKGGLALAQSAQELITTSVTHNKQPFGLPETVISTGAFWRKPPPLDLLHNSLQA